jgi:serine phosphatase RsbU (regulator of sigma subunit)
MPAREVGGDYYDYFQLSRNRLGIVLGDVSGKGTSAALYMSQLQGFFRALTVHFRDVRKLICQVNRLAYSNVASNAFITLIFALLNPGSRELTLVRAGHTAAFYYNARKKACEKWAPPGMGMALDEGTLFQRVLGEDKRTMSRGDAILLYSDGLTEAVNPAGEELGVKRLMDLFMEHIAQPADQLARSLVQKIEAFADTHPQADDITLVVLKVDK